MRKLRFRLLWGLTWYALRKQLAPEALWPASCNSWSCYSGPNVLLRLLSAVLLIRFPFHQENNEFFQVTIINVESYRIFFSNRLALRAGKY